MDKIARGSVPAAEQTRDHSRAIGSILVEQGRLRPSDIDEIQKFATKAGIRFGDAAIKLNLLTQNDVDVALAQQFNYPVLPRGAKNGVSDDVVAAYLPQSELVEPLRALRSQLSLRWINGLERRILVIASPGRGDGRSWLAANLATVFAQMGERVLLIDADMRNPRQHQMFNLNNSVGLSALLTGRAGREAVCRIHPQLRLYVLPAGLKPPNPQELLGRPVFEVVLKSFAEQYDLIIIDSPAMTQASDAQLLAVRAGTAIIIARRNRTLHSELASSMQDLVQSGVSVLGGVLNEF